MRRNKIIEEIENSQLKDVPDFSPGDTVSVQVRVKEGNRERLQAYEGVVIGVALDEVRGVFHRARLRLSETEQRAAVLDLQPIVVQGVHVDAQRRLLVILARTRHARRALLQRRIVDT